LNIAAEEQIHAESVGTHIERLGGRIPEVVPVHVPIQAWMNGNGARPWTATRSTSIRVTLKCIVHSAPKLGLDDKLDGTVTREFFDRQSELWREEQSKISAEIATHQNANLSSSFATSGFSRLKKSCTIFKP
jgi:hypothetical protein